MFERLGFVERWRIPQSNLMRFVLTVRKSYRTPTYHNWQHAFSVGHFAFLCLVNASERLSGFLTGLEMLSLFVAALCHDIDHRGFNNHYQCLSSSTLASLYGASGSILEQHHLSHTMRILSLDECNILTGLSDAEYRQVKQLLRQIILATDLAHHLKVFPHIEQMSITGFYPDTADHPSLLLSLMVTSSDLSDQCKSWTNTRIAASLLYDEFFNQGHAERALGHEPAASMDPRKAFIPVLQVSFLDSVVIPCFRALSLILPECEPAFDAVGRNRHVWAKFTQAVQSGQVDSFTTDRLLRGHYDDLVKTLASTDEGICQCDCVPRDAD
ncbi:unnamed protein product [Echinostoma caproni]|uniref:PDEase domain-containing protein n=1 Tax=Echinostoma caproni TaxID=27848 RepID=A0A183AAE7_9TREM|nr:unnamed protein product [Echinostoma caproni]